LLQLSKKMENSDSVKQAQYHQFITFLYIRVDIVDKFESAMTKMHLLYKIILKYQTLNNQMFLFFRLEIMRRILNTDAFSIQLFRDFKQYDEHVKPQLLENLIRYNFEIIKTMTF
jgi:hypothetical protein